MYGIIVLENMKNNNGVRLCIAYKQTVTAPVRLRTGYRPNRAVRVRIALLSALNACHLDNFLSGNCSITEVIEQL